MKGLGRLVKKCGNDCPGPLTNGETMSMHCMVFRASIGPSSMAVGMVGMVGMLYPLRHTHNHQKMGCSA